MTNALDWARQLSKLVAVLSFIFSFRLFFPKPVEIFL